MSDCDAEEIRLMCLPAHVNDPLMLEILSFSFHCYYKINTFVHMTFRDKNIVPSDKDGAEEKGLMKCTTIHHSETFRHAGLFPVKLFEEACYLRKPTKQCCFYLGNCHMGFLKKQKKGGAACIFISAFHTKWKKENI